MILSLDFYECLSKICDMLHVTCLRFNALDFYDMFNALESCYRKSIHAHVFMSSFNLFLYRYGWGGGCVGAAY